MFHETPTDPNEKDEPKTTPPPDEDDGPEMTDAQPVDFEDEDNDSALQEDTPDAQPR